MVGVPHADFGEAVVAVVVARPARALDGDALIAALKARIANFKVPKAMFVVAELPRNAMGKVQKNLLREHHAPAVRLTAPARRARAGRALSGAAATSSLPPPRPDPCDRRSASGRRRATSFRSSTVIDSSSTIDRAKPRMPSSFEISWPMAPRRVA